MCHILKIYSFGQYSFLLIISRILPIYTKGLNTLACPYEMNPNIEVTFAVYIITIISMVIDTYSQVDSALSCF